MEGEGERLSEYFCVIDRRMDSEEDCMVSEEGEQVSEGEPDHACSWRLRGLF